MAIRSTHPTTTSLRNTGKVDNTGIEMQATWHINKTWTVNINYSFLHMKNPLTSAPKHKLCTTTALETGISLNI